MEEIPIYLKAGDLFVYASLTETQGLVTMEALAAGLPVVAVDATGTRDVIQDKVDGFLTDDDCHALAVAMLRLIDDPVLRQQIRENLNQSVKNFDLMEQAKKLLAVYEQAIEDKKAGFSIQVDKLLYT